MRVALVLLVCAACGGGNGAGADARPDARPDAAAATDPAALERTIVELTALGERRAGTPAGEAAATYMAARLEAAGLEDVHRESFRLPRHDVRAATMDLRVDGEPRAVAFDVLEACGPGTIDAEVVFAGDATPGVLETVDVEGKIALVVRSVLFHRSSQYRNVAAAGARAMIYVSDAPDNLRQVGSVRTGFEALGPIPALSIGAADGAALRDRPVRAAISVDVVSTPASGHNVVGRLAGARPDQLVVGAHFDSWLSGANDNAAGAAALVALAERRARRGPPRHTIVFVAYDGEEPGLYGGYDYMHKHRGVEPMAALLGLEVPAPRETTLLAFGRSNHAALDEALQAAGLRNLYPLYVSMDVVPALFGGIIPTDVQGLYRDGVPTATTATAYAHYHTSDDVTARVDTVMLAQVVDAFDAALDALDAAPEGAFAVPDPRLWRAEVTVTPGSGKLAVAVVVRDGAGVVVPDARVDALLLVDDFFQVGAATGRTAADGSVTLDLDDVPGASRYVHVTSGTDYPLVEKVIRL